MTTARSTALNNTRSALIPVTLIVIVIIGILIRLLFMARPMFYDEALTFIEYATISLPRLVARYNTPNNHIFHSVLMWISYHLFNSGEPFIIRLPVFITGILSIPAAYWVGARFYHPRVGLLTAALVAVSLPMIDYSVNARGYSIQVFIILLMLVIAHHVKTRNNLLLWGAFSILAALGFWTIPVMLYPMGGIALWLLLSIALENKGASRLRGLVSLFASLALGAALTVVLYLPAIQSMGLSTILQNDYISPRTIEYSTIPTLEALQTAAARTVTPQTTPTILESTPQASSPTLTPAPTLRSPYTTFDAEEIPVRSVNERQLSPFWRNYQRLGEILIVGVPLPLVFLLALGLVIGLTVHRKNTPDKIPLLLGIALWIIPFSIVYRVLLPTRTWLFMVPIVALYVALGLSALTDWLWDRLSRDSNPVVKRSGTTIFAIFTLALTAVIGVSVVINRDTLHDFQTDPAPDAQAVARALQTITTPDDVVMIRVPYYAPVRYYLEINGFDSENIVSDYTTDTYFIREQLDSNVYAFVTDKAPPTLDGISEQYYINFVDLNPTLTTAAEFAGGTLLRIHTAPNPNLELYAHAFEGVRAPIAFTFAESARWITLDEGGHAIQFGDPATDQVVSLSPDRGRKWRDTITSVDLTINQLSTESNQPAASISVRALRFNRDIQPEYLVYFDPVQDEIGIGAGRRGIIERVLASVPAELEMGVTYTITIEMIGQTISASIRPRSQPDSQPFTISAEGDDPSIERGTVFFNAAPGTVITIDNVRVVRP